MADESGSNSAGDAMNMKPVMDEKSSEYLKDLLQEKGNMDPSQNLTLRLLDQEISRVQAGGKPPGKESKYVDIYREKPIRVTVKVSVPVKEHPKFNFVGKLLGPKGNSMKRLQEETMTKMAVLGRGSMRDKAKEEELRASQDPKYQHLNEDLHVEISSFAPPAEAHARVAYALAEVRKYMIPDNNDEIRQEQMREMELLNGEPNGVNGTMPSRRPVPGPLALRGRGRGGPGQGLPLRGAIRGIPRGRGGFLAPPVGRGGPGMRKPVPPPPPPMTRPPPTKQKVLSILDKARVAMEESYGYEEDGFYDSYDTYDASGFGYEEFDDNGDYYDPESYTDTAGGRWKGFKSPAGIERTRFRQTPYPRPK